MPQVTFNNQKKSFFNSLNARVEEYFQEKNLKKTGNKKLYLKSIILITAAVATYVALLAINMHPVIAAALCCLLGVMQAGIGFNVMHDANHGSFSTRKWINNLMGLTANMMGANAWMWKQKHNIVHHTYTNVDGVDEDIAKSPFLRMCPSQKKFKAHRYQHIYCVPLYALSSFMMIVGDFKKYFTKQILVTQLRKMSPSEHLMFWLSKAVYFFFLFALPAMLFGVVPALVGFALMHATLGLTLAVVFQLAHVVESTHFVDAKHTAVHVEDEWAVHQVQTTADFATGNKMVSWFTGGLNFQVEHHLFPKISHVHYPVIHNFVKEACHKFSLRFNNYPSMTSALRSHFRFMKQLGTS